MKSKSFLSRCCVFLLLFACAFGMMAPAHADNQNSSINRYNVVLVMDASNSMNYSDKEALRYAAARQFTILLAEQGNYLGGIVFANKIEAQKEPALISNESDKTAVVDLLKSFMSHEVSDAEGYTNTGEALSAAVQMLNDKGSKDLPSVIVFLSDGNTEMPDEESQAASLEQKAEAIQAARENDISIYSVCLNSNGKADPAEMAQISQATGGVFQEVNNAKDLEEVFKTFYTMIYGTSTVEIGNYVFPDDGVVNTDFEVPGIGVEEVNIVINGRTKSVSFTTPGGSPAKVNQYVSDVSAYTMIKLTDVVPGKWTMTTQGVPGDHIHINMIYNTDLTVEMKTDLAKDAAVPNDPIKFTAALASGSSVQAPTADQCVGYNAELCVMDAYGKEIDRIPMPLNGDHFELEHGFPEGVYHFRTDVTGHYLNKSSQELGPITVTASAAPPNNPPRPVETPVKETVYVLPGKGADLTIDMSGLATDVEDSSLTYTINSSSFIEGTDYTVSDNTISMTDFSLSTGSFDIKATDKGGLSCHIEVIIKSYNVGIMALLGIALIALIVLIIFGISLRIALSKPFNGPISCEYFSGGSHQGAERAKKRGRMNLAVFQLGNTGLDPNKCYFQASGQNYVTLVTNTPVMYKGNPTKKVTILSGMEAIVYPKQGDSTRSLRIRYTCQIKKSFTSGKLPKKPVKPAAPQPPKSGFGFRK